MTSPIRPSTRACEPARPQPVGARLFPCLFLALLLAAAGYIRAEGTDRPNSVIRLPIAFTPVNHSDGDWRNGIDRMARNRFIISMAIGQEQPVQSGYRLSFAHSGEAKVVEIYRMISQNRQLFFVRVDKKLDPAGDGFPHPIRLLSPLREIRISLPPLETRNREHGWLPLLLVLIPLTHFLLAVFMPGLVMAVILERWWPARRNRPLDKLWLALACGLIYNTLQFLLVLWSLDRHWLSQPVLAWGKYAMDMTVLIVAAIFIRRNLAAGLVSIARAVGSRRNLPVLLLAVMVGVLAVLRYPHTFDSGQLIQTNTLFMTGRNAFSGFRLSYGFSALVYFPAFNPWNIAMATVSGGFKLPLTVLLGLLSCSVVDRIHLHRPSAVRLLLFVMLLANIYGLYGIVELGKDSVWGVLFSLAAMVMAWRSPQPLTVGLLFIVAALMGVIAIPFCLIFLTIWLIWTLIRKKPSVSTGLHWLAIGLPLLGAMLLMPVYLPQFMPPMFNDPLAAHIGYPPADGRTGFSEYFFCWGKNSCSNVPPVIAAGILGALLLPVLGRQFASLSLRSLSASVPLATFCFLLLALPAQGWLPSKPGQHIPWIPLSPFDLWNLIKDMAQWYIQPVCAIMTLIVFQVGRRISRRLPKRRQRHVLALMATPLLLGSLITNHSRLYELIQPAHFHSVTGHADPVIASVFDFITGLGESKCSVLIDDTLPLPQLRSLAWDIGHFRPGVKAQYLKPDMTDKLPALKNLPLPLLMIVAPDWLQRLQRLYPQAAFRTFCFDERRMIGVFYCIRADGDLLRAEKNRSTTPTKPGSAVFRTNS